MWEPDIADIEIPRCHKGPEDKAELPFTVSTMLEELSREIWCCEQIFWTEPWKTITSEDRNRIAQSKRVCDILKKGGPESLEEEVSLREIKNRTECAACGQSGHWQGDVMCPKTSKVVGTKKDFKHGSKRKSVSDIVPHSSETKSRALPQPGGWQRVPCDEARRFLLQQLKMQAERFFG